jgi:hypothetical protein
MQVKTTLTAMVKE